MKRKAMVVVLLCVLGIAAFSIGNAEAVATPPWYNCTLQLVGSHVNFFFVIATTDNTAAWTGPRFFLIDSNPVTNPNGKADLAAALTAYASGGACALNLPDTTAFSTILAISAGSYPF